MKKISEPIPPDVVRQRIRDFILRNFPLAKKRNIGDDHHLLEAGVIDSLGVLDVVGFLEDDFGVSVGDDELVPENFKSIESLASFVGRKNSAGR